MFAGRSQAASEPPYSSKSSKKKKSSGSSSSSTSKSKRTSKSDSGKPSSSSRSISAEYESSSRREEYEEDRRRYSSEDNDNYQPATRSTTSSSKRDNRDSSSRTSRYAPTSNGPSRAQRADDDDDDDNDYDEQSRDPGDQTTQGNVPQIVEPNNQADHNASLLPNQFPNQVPQDYSIPASRPSTPLHGLASDYYGDQGESVQFQPGVRPNTPIITDAEPHLMAALPVSNPPSETGDGAAAEFFSGASFSPQPPAGSNSAYSTPAVGAGAASASGKPGKNGKTSSSHKPLLAAAGAAGLGAAAAYAHHHHHHNQDKPQSKKGQSSNYASTSSKGYTANITSSGGATEGGRALPDPYPVGMATSSREQYRERGTLGKFADWWNNYEDVRKMEEYTEYIGVCKYCFDPHSSPRDAPRKHQPRRRSSREFRDRRRVSKQSRYSKASSSSSDSEDGGGNKGFWTAAGAAGLGALGLASADNKKSRKEFDDYSIRTGTVDPDVEVGVPQRQDSTKASAYYAQDAPQYEETFTRRQSKPTRDTRNRDDAVIGAVAGAASAAGVANIIADSATPDKRRRSSTSKRAGRARRSTVSSNDARSQSSDSDANVGFFGRIFSPGSSKKNQKPRRKTSGVYQNESLNSSMASGLAYGREEPSSRRRKSSKREPTAKDASNAILGLGAATAMLAAAGSKGHRDSARDPELGVTRDSRYKPSKPPLTRDRFQQLDGDQNEDGWEDASQSDDASSVDTGLAFGDFHANRSGSSKKKQSRRQSSPRATSRKATGTVLPTIVASPPTIPTDLRSEEAVDENIVSGPLRYVEPRPISDHTSPSRPPKLQSNVRDVPLQQPQPKSAVRPPSYDVVSEPPRPYIARAETLPKDFGDSPFPEGYSFPKRRRTDPMSSISSMQSPMSSHPSGDVSPGSRNGSGNLIRHAAIAAAVAGTAVGVASTVDDYNERRSRRQSVRFAPDEPERRHSASRVERTSQAKDIPPETSERRPRRSYGDKPSSEPSYYEQPYRTLPAADDRAERTSSVNDRDAKVQQREVVDPVDTPAVVASGAIDPPSVDSEPMPHAVEIRRQGQIRDNHEPILDDDIMDPNFFKRGRADSEPQETGRPRTASFYVADLEQRYSSNAPTMAEFFAPPELSHRSPAENSREVEPPDTFSDTRRSNSITTRDISEPTGPGAASQKAVPRLNVIAPTPPLSEAGSVKDPNSRSPSPLSTPVKIDEPELDQEDTEPISRPRNRVTWADQSVVNGEEARSQPVESAPEPVTPPSSAGTDAYRTVDIRPKQYVPGSLSDDDDASVEDHKFSPPRSRKSLADVASEAMNRSVENDESQHVDDHTKGEQVPETGESRSAPRSFEPSLAADENNDTGMRSQVQEEKDITPVSRDIEDDSSTVLPMDRSSDSLADLERFAASSGLSETGQLSEPIHFREYKDVPEMIRLPDSPPSSPKEVDEQQTPSSREAGRPPTTPHSGRTPSATAIPISYFRRTPQSPISKDSPAASSPATEQSSPTSTTKRTSRPNSTEFKSNEIRPLYLLERNRKPTPIDQDETYPSLPSSHTTSRASSVHGGESEEAFESARESQTASPAQSFRSFEDDHDGEYLDSQQPTPKASAVSEGIEDVPDQPLDSFSVGSGQVESREAPEPSIPSVASTEVEEIPSSNLAEPTTPTGHRELGETPEVSTIADEPQQDLSTPSAIDLTQPLDPADEDDSWATQTSSKSKKGKKGKKNKKGPPAPITTAAVLGSAATIKPKSSTEPDSVDAPVTTTDEPKGKSVTDDASALDPPLTATREFAPEIEPPVADQLPSQSQDDLQSRDLTEHVDKLEEQIMQHSQLESTGEGPQQESDITDDVILEDYERWKASRVPEGTAKGEEELPSQEDDLLPEDIAAVSDIINRRPSQSSTKDQSIQGSGLTRSVEQSSVPEEGIKVLDTAPSTEVATDIADSATEPVESLTAPAVSESREIEAEDAPDASQSFSWMPPKTKKKGKKGKKVKQAAEAFEPEPEPVEPEPVEPEPVEPEPTELEPVESEPVEPDPVETAAPSQDVVISSEPQSTAEEEWDIPTKVGKKGKKKKKQAARAFEIEPETIEPIAAPPETSAEPEARKASIGEDEWDTTPIKGKKGKKKKKETMRAFDPEPEFVESEVQSEEISTDPEVRQAVVDEEEWTRSTKGKKKKGKGRKASIPLAATAMVSAAAATAALAAGRDDDEDDQKQEADAGEAKSIDPSFEQPSVTTEDTPADVDEDEFTPDRGLVESATEPAVPPVVLEPSVEEPSLASEIEVDHPPAALEATRDPVPVEHELELAEVESAPEVPSDNDVPRQVGVIEPTPEPIVESTAVVRDTDTMEISTVAGMETNLETQKLLEDEPAPITETVPTAEDAAELETTRNIASSGDNATLPQAEHTSLDPEALRAAEIEPTSDSDALLQRKSAVSRTESIEDQSEDIQQGSRDIVPISDDIPSSEPGLNESESTGPVIQRDEPEQTIIPAVEPVEVPTEAEWSVPIKSSKKQKKKDKKKKSTAKSLALDTSLPESSTSSDIDQVNISQGDASKDTDDPEASATPSSGKVEKKLRFAAEPAEVIPPLSPVVSPGAPIEIAEASRSAPSIVPGAFPEPDSDEPDESSRDIETAPTDQPEDTDTREFMEELNKEEAQSSDEQEANLAPVHGPGILSLPNKLPTMEPRSTTDENSGYTDDIVIDAAEPAGVTRPDFERQTTSDFISELREEENQSISEDIVPQAKLTEPSSPVEVVDVSRSIDEDVPSMTEAEPTSQDQPSDSQDAIGSEAFTEGLEQQDIPGDDREIAEATYTAKDEDVLAPGESAIEKDQDDDLALAEDGAAPEDPAEAEPEEEFALPSKSKKKKKKGKNRDVDESLEPSVTESPPAEADPDAGSTPENKSSKSKKSKKDKKGKKLSLFSVFSTGESSSKSKSSKKSSSKAKEEETESPNIESATTTALDEPEMVENQPVIAEQILTEEPITDDAAFVHETPSGSQSREIDADQFLEGEKDLEEDLPDTTQLDERDMDDKPVPEAEIAEPASSTRDVEIVPAQDDEYSTTMVPVAETELKTEVEESKEGYFDENIQPAGHYSVSDEDIEVGKEAAIEAEAQVMLKEEKDLEEDRMDLDSSIPRDVAESDMNDTADSGTTFQTIVDRETQPSMLTEQEEVQDIAVHETTDAKDKEMVIGPTETVEPEESIPEVATSEPYQEETPIEDAPLEEERPVFTVKKSKKEKRKAKKAKKTQESLFDDDDVAEEAQREDNITSTMTREAPDPIEPATEELPTIVSEQVSTQDPSFTESLASTLEASGFSPTLATADTSDQTRSITTAPTDTAKISEPTSESKVQESLWTKPSWSFSAADNNQSTQSGSTEQQPIQSELTESKQTVTRSVAGEDSTEQPSHSKDTDFDDIVALSLGSAGFDPRTAEGYKAREESDPMDRRTSSMDVENEIGTVTMRTPSPKGPAEQWLSSSRGGSPVYAEPKSTMERNIPETEIDSSQALPEEIPFHSQKKKKKGKKARKSSLEPEPYWEDQAEQAQFVEPKGVAEGSGTSTDAAHRDSALHMPEEVEAETQSSTHREVRDSGYHDTMPTTPASKTSEFDTEGQRTIPDDVEMNPPSPSLEREPSPVESTSKERTSSLFQTAPTLLAAESIRDASEHLEENEPQETSPSTARRDLQPTVEDAPLSPNYETGTIASNFPVSAPPHSRNTSRELGTIPEHDAGLPAPSQHVPDVPEEFAPPTLSEVANSRRPYARGSDRASPVAEFGRPLSATSARSSNRSGSQVLRRSNPSSDLGAEFKRGEAQARALGYPANENLKKSPSEVSSKVATEPPPSYDPLKGIGRVSSRDMSDTGYYEGVGDARDPPRSPSRPQSVRTRKSLQQIADLESRLDQVKAENQALRDGKGIGPSSSTSRGLGDEASLEPRDEVLRQKDIEINTIKASLQTLQAEVSRLSQHNDQLNEQNRNLSGDTNERYAQMQVEQDELHQQWWQAARDLDDEREQHNSLKAGMEAAVAQRISSKLEDKNAEIESLRTQLTEATEKIGTLQSQIQQSSTGERGLPGGDGSGGSMGIDDFLNVRNDDYFESACHQLCSHVQQWVLRFSKFSDMRQCRLARDLHDEGLETRLDNAILDGTDVDIYLADRVKRRDVFMALMMTLVWEYVFTRYLFGMDRQQRQTLKNLEKTLSEVGPPRAVAQWRATTLTLLSRRQQFTQQRDDDTEAVVQEVFGTLSTLLPPPRNLSEQAMNSLRNVLRLAVDLSIEMRTQRPEYVMLPPLHPEYDTNGDLVRKVAFNSSLMNERSGEFADNGELEVQERSVRMVLFPLVVRKGDEQGEGSEEVVVAPAQVLVSRSEEEERRSAGARGGGSSSRSARGLGTDYGNRSQMSVAPPSSGP